MRSLLCLALLSCSPADSAVSRAALLDDEAGAAAPLISVHEDVGFGYTSRPEGRENEFDIDFSLKSGGELEFQVCRPEGGGQYSEEEFRCPVLQQGRMKLPALQEKQLRALLLVSRPSKLSVDGPFLLPRGCDFVMHGSRVYSVSFFDEKKFGAFLVQQRTDCEGMDEARAYIRSLLRILPDQSVIERYPVYWPSAD